MNEARGFGGLNAIFGENRHGAKNEAQPRLKLNGGLIPNLPDWAIVEVPATVDATGVHGLSLGPLPEPIAAMCRTQAAVIDRVVEAGVHGDRHAALEALLLDRVITSISQAEAVLSEMLAVHREFLPQFRREEGVRSRE